MQIPFSHTLLACAACTACACTAALTPAHAQQNLDPETSTEAVVITANPLERERTTVPSSVLGRADLLARGHSTLGETLNGLPGVSSTYFGPNASRPIIRGLDGDRIRVLTNSGASLDASALSYDHAVPLDTLTTERIEVLRGPAALQYGGSAIGGVVNVIDNRIPQQAITGVGGKAQIQGATGNAERGLAGLVEVGNGRWALHADGFERRSSDVRVPAELACDTPEGTRHAKRICNSAAQTRGGALGASTFWANGQLGASVSNYQSDYGTVAEDQVRIGMHTTRYTLDAQVRQLPGLLQKIKVRMGHTDYRHTEFDNGTPGTVFANKGHDLRVEAQHAALAGWQGVWGLHTESSQFAATGEEAFAPASRTRSHALFAHEERPMPWGHITAGARWESVHVQSLGNAEVPRFAPSMGSHTFNPWSLAAGTAVQISPDWVWTSHAALTQRAPKDYELFANGPHLATHAWEQGSTALATEKARSLDTGFAWKSGHNHLSVSAFVSQFANYIGLLGSPEVIDELPVQRYLGMRAQFRGLEASGRQRLWQRHASLDLDWRADTVRARNPDTGEPLPRIAPTRMGAALTYGRGPWQSKLGADWHSAQRRVPTGSVATAAYTLVNASMSYRQHHSAAMLHWFARLDNLTNQLAYSASSILTSTAFGKSPLPGRSVKLGVQAHF